MALEHRSLSFCSTASDSELADHSVQLCTPFEFILKKRRKWFTIQIIARLPEQVNRLLDEGKADEHLRVR